MKGVVDQLGIVGPESLTYMQNFVHNHLVYSAVTFYVKICQILEGRAPAIKGNGRFADAWVWATYSRPQILTDATIQTIAGFHDHGALMRS